LPVDNELEVLYIEPTSLYCRCEQTPCDDDDKDFAILRFRAGPPYEVTAFVVCFDFV